MEQFDFDCPAELYVATGRGMAPKAMSYRRFLTGAEAIKYAMESVGTDKLWGTVIETETARLGAAEINALYRRDDYPLRRLQR